MQAFLNNVKIFQNRLKSAINLWYWYFALLHALASLKQTWTTCNLWKQKWELKKWEETRDYVSCFSLHFFRALATSFVLYNRTEHSQGFSIC